MNKEKEIISGTIMIIGTIGIVAGVLYTVSGFMEDNNDLRKEKFTKAGLGLLMGAASIRALGSIIKK